MFSWAAASAKAKEKKKKKSKPAASRVRKYPATEKKTLLNDFKLTFLRVLIGLLKNEANEGKKPNRNNWAMKIEIKTKKITNGLSFIDN